MYVFYPDFSIWILDFSFASFKFRLIFRKGIRQSYEPPLNVIAIFCNGGIKNSNRLNCLFMGSDYLWTLSAFHGQIKFGRSQVKNSTKRHTFRLQHIVLNQWQGLLSSLHWSISLSFFHFHTKECV